MKKNLFKYSKLSLNNLRDNPQHNFAANHSMMLYNANALYSFIPKNACSTMRLSLAIANGCIESIDQGHWIHNNNNTFNATLSEAIQAKYTFIILRCPYRRLASAFLDKLVGKEIDAWQYREHLQREINLDDLTFKEFVFSLSKPENLRANIHWCPQVDFLLYENYDNYFCVEFFSNAVTALKEKIDLDVIDARKLTNHGLDSLVKIADESFSNVAAFDLSMMKRKGQSPDYLAMYDQETYEIVTQLYKVDLELYSEKIGENGLLKLN